MFEVAMYHPMCCFLAKVTQKSAHGRIIATNAVILSRKSALSRIILQFEVKSLIILLLYICYIIVTEPHVDFSPLI